MLETPQTLSSEEPDENFGRVIASDCCPPRFTKVFHLITQCVTRPTSCSTHGRLYRHHKLLYCLRMRQSETACTFSTSSALLWSLGRYLSTDSIVFFAECFNLCNDSSVFELSRPTKSSTVLPGQTNQFSYIRRLLHL
jgi:hypothetical protein